jgi:hypothetical protein
MVNQRPLMEAIADAAPSDVKPDDMERRFKNLRGYISGRLDEAGLIERPYERAWRWTLIANATLPSEKDLPELPEATGTAIVTLESAEKARQLNGALPHLGERLTVVGMRLEADGIRIEAQRDDDDTVIDLTILEEVTHGS